MDATAAVILALTVLAIVAIVVHLVRHPGPDARHVTRRPVSERRASRFRDLPEYPGVDRPAGPGAEAERVVDPGQVSTNGNHSEERGRHSGN